MSKRSNLKKLGTGLAGAVAIASGTSAYGTVIVVNPPADLTNSPGGANTMVTWDVNTDGTADFLFRNRYPDTAPGTTGVVWQQQMDPATAALATTNGVVSYLGAFVRYAFALGAGVSVGPTNTNFSTVTQVVLGSRYNYGSGSYYYGGFAAGPDGAANGAVTPGTFAFVGFRFNAADGVHFGWVKLAVNAGIIDFQNIMGAAYESTPNTAIVTGVPEPGTMALLALGAAGIVGTVVKRRRA
jgi:hypothetical protein